MTRILLSAQPTIAGARENSGPITIDVTDDPAAFWKSLSPTLILALAKAMPRVAVVEGDTIYGYGARFGTGAERIVLDHNDAYGRANVVNAGWLLADAAEGA